MDNGMMMLNELFALQKKNRWKISETSAEVRRSKLELLKHVVQERREEIKVALYKDFKKPYAETELTEIHTVLDEINYARKNLRGWMRPKKVSTPITLFGSRSEIHYEAKGLCLILSPWNYPFSLLINPLIAAVAAGNCVIARPSEKTPHTGVLIKKIIEAVFSQDEVAIVLGEVHVAEELLNLPFDHIFFTGSTPIGKKVMAAAAKNLATVTLELGGKSPVIIDSEVDLHSAVKKLVWGKFMNGGQTCVAPDYVFIPKELKESFMDLFKECVLKSYGDTSLARRNSPDFARIIDQGNFQRLLKKIENEKKQLSDEEFAGDNYLPPTFFETTLTSPIMEEEIFGPVLPLITYKSIDEVIRHIQNEPKPLALYLFSKRKDFCQNVLQKTTSGGAVINDVILHLANPALPFGGVGHSGQGNYHGHFGFLAFSHAKSVLRQGKFSLMPLYFPPYTGRLSRFAFKLLRLFE
jgi:aldehyde dehydrogenase (NAD+)